MNVQELIEKLILIENKSVEVVIDGTDPYQSQPIDFISEPYETFVRTKADKIPVVCLS